MFHIRIQQSYKCSSVIFSLLGHSYSHSSRPKWQLQVIWGVLGPSLRSPTHLGSPGWVIVEITATHDPWPLVRLLPKEIIFAIASGQGNPLLWTRWGDKEEESSFEKWFLSYWPDKDMSRVVCMGCTTAVFISVLVILVLVTPDPLSFLCLHIFVSKLLLFNYFFVYSSLNLCRYNHDSLDQLFLEFYYSLLKGSHWCFAY